MGHIAAECKSQPKTRQRTPDKRDSKRHTRTKNKKRSTNNRRALHTTTERRDARAQARQELREYYDEEVASESDGSQGSDSDSPISSVNMVKQQALCTKSTRLRPHGLAMQTLPGSPSVKKDTPSGLFDGPIPLSRQPTSAQFLKSEIVHDDDCTCLTCSFSKTVSHGVALGNSNDPDSMENKYDSSSSSALDGDDALLPKCVRRKLKTARGSKIYPASSSEDEVDYAMRRVAEQRRRRSRRKPIKLSWERSEYLPHSKPQRALRSAMLRLDESEGGYKSDVEEFETPIPDAPRLGPMDTPKPGAVEFSPTPERLSSPNASKQGGQYIRATGADNIPVLEPYMTNSLESNTSNSILSFMTKYERKSSRRSLDQQDTTVAASSTDNENDLLLYVDTATMGNMGYPCMFKYAKRVWREMTQIRGAIGNDGSEHAIK